MDVFTLLYHTGTSIISIEHNIDKCKLWLSNGMYLEVSGDKILVAIEKDGTKLDSQGDLEAYLKECSQEFTT